MNGQLELRIITQPYSEGYWGYFRRLVFGNSLTKHIKLFFIFCTDFFLPISHIPPCFRANRPSRFPTYRLIFVLTLPISHIPPCFRANPPDFPRLIGPRDISPCLLKHPDQRMPHVSLVGRDHCATLQTSSYCYPEYVFTEIFWHPNYARKAGKQLVHRWYGVSSLTILTWNDLDLRSAPGQDPK